MADAAIAPDTEAQVITAARGGDQRAFESLYRRHSGWVYGLCLRLTCQRELAEECTQEAFVSAWRGLSKFEQRSQFSSWLHRIAVNTVLARRPRGGDLKLVSVEDNEQQVRAVPGDADAGGPIDLERAIAQLPRGARDVLVLVGIYGHSHDEAAEMLGVAAGTCKAQLHRARSLLSASLGLEESSV